MSEPAQKCEELFLSKTQKLFFALEMAYYRCFSLRGSTDFLQKSFITLATGHVPIFLTLAHFLLSL